VDADDTGVSAVVTLEAVCLSIGAQPGRIVRGGAVDLFVVLQRFPSGKAPRRERHSVYWTNLAIFGDGGHVDLDFRFEAYLVLQGAVILWPARRDVVVLRCSISLKAFTGNEAVSGLHGAALRGSSFYKIARHPPMVLRQYRISITSTTSVPGFPIITSKVPQIGAGLSERAAGHAVLQLQVSHLPPLG